MRFSYIATVALLPLAFASHLENRASRNCADVANKADIPACNAARAKAKADIGSSSSETTDYCADSIDPSGCNTCGELCFAAVLLEIVACSVVLEFGVAYVACTAAAIVVEAQCLQSCTQNYPPAKQGS